jgi:AcrR family transcriptional regulator
MSEDTPDRAEKPAKKVPIWRHQGSTHAWKHHGPPNPQHRPIQRPQAVREPIWTRPARQPQGKRPSLSREQIVRAAIEIADAEGMEAVTMRRLATKLGAGAMSLYWHVPNKDDLLDLMLDAAFGEVELPERLSGDWRADLRLYAHAQRQALRRHSWLATFIAGRALPGPNVLRFGEFCLAAVDGLGLDVSTMAGILSTVDAYTDGFVQREIAEAENRRRTGLTGAEWHAAVAPHFQALIASGRYPTVARTLTDMQSLNTGQFADVSFAFGLECLLDGIAVRIDAATGRDGGHSGDDDPPTRGGS